jgi:hypothetical protein
LKKREREKERKKKIKKKIEKIEIKKMHYLELGIVEFIYNCY